MGCGCHQSYDFCIYLYAVRVPVVPCLNQSYLKSLKVVILGDCCGGGLRKRSKGNDQLGTASVLLLSVQSEGDGDVNKDGDGGGDAELQKRANRATRLVLIFPGQC